MIATLSNLLRTLRTMEGYGLVRLECGERGRITPKVMHDRVWSWTCRSLCHGGKLNTGTRRRRRKAGYARRSQF